jgi:prefoldin alpha subunit
MSSQKAQGQPQVLDLSTLSVQELQSIHQQISNELNQFTSSMIALQRTASRFAAAGQSVESLNEYKDGSRLMLPMTESLYVPGELSSSGHVLVEVGTGYFVERDVKGGVTYCRNKVMEIKEQVGELSRVINQRQEVLMRVVGVLQEKAA